MPLVQDYQIYCDETLQRGAIAFALGALICTPRRSEVLRYEIRKLRLARTDGAEAYSGEVKWDKLARSTLHFYSALIDVFLDDPYARFAVMRVQKGQHWNKWAKTEEERFFKTYYHFLMQIAGPFSRYDVYVDEKTLQRAWRWDTLHYLINKSRRENWGLKGRNIRNLNPVDSASDDLIQLTDLLLGGVVSTAGAPAKMKIRQKVTANIAARTVRDNAKFRTWDWSPKM